MLARVLVLLVLATTAASAAPPTQLAADRVAAAEKVYTAMLAKLKTGHTTVEVVYQWSVRWLDAELAAAPKQAKRALVKHTFRMTELGVELIKAASAGTASPVDADAAAYFALEAKYWQARGKRQ